PGRRSAPGADGLGLRPRRGLPRARRGGGGGARRLLAGRAPARRPDARAGRDERRRRLALSRWPRRNESPQSEPRLTLPSIFTLEPPKLARVVISDRTIWGKEMGITRPLSASRLDPMDFHILQKSLLLSAPRMTKLQLLDLADALHDELRARRGRED